MPKLRLEFLTEDKQNKKICELYWKIDNRGKFLHKVSALAGRFNIREIDLYKIIRKCCRVYNQASRCEVCGQPTGYFYSRSSLIESDWGFAALCKGCENEKLIEMEREEKERHKRQLKEKLKKMQIAYMNGTYEQLNKLEFNFLVALAGAESPKNAMRQLGLSQNNAEALFDKLNRLDLIIFDPETDRYHILPGPRKALIEVGQRRTVRSIFPSPQAIRVYQKLKGKYLFVYPEIPICVFIEMKDVEHLFKREWHKNYFLTCRVDFIVCDQEGIPKFAVEYQGGGHESEEQRVKDLFKKRVLNEVGLNLREIRKRELSSFENDFKDSDRTEDVYRD